MRVLSLVPWAMPPVVVAIMWSLLLRPTSGPIEGVFTFLHIPGARTDWLGDFNTALPTVILIGAWVGMPIITVSILAALQGIPTEMVEASVIDGANAWQRFRYITLPAVRAITTALVALNIIWNFSSFGLVFVLTAGGPGAKPLCRHSLPTTKLSNMETSDMPHRWVSLWPLQSWACFQFT
jgi:multiple sugar transport system permease protein